MFTPRVLLTIFVATASLHSVARPGVAQEPAVETIRSLNEALREGNRESAASIADSMLEQSQQPAVLQRAADAKLRAGHLEAARKLYDRYVSARPEREPYLWQRGIALALTGRFREGAIQFEKHQAVNPYDVENAGWHFYCVAKRWGVDQARARLLPAPGDARPPMKEVLSYLRSGDREPVIERMHSFPVGSQQRRRAEFYGNLYLGLIADADDKPQRAIRYLERSVEHAEHDYMGDVARLYLALLKEKKQSARLPARDDTTRDNQTRDD